MKPLGEVAITGSGSTPKADDEAFYKGGTVPFVRIADLNDGHVARTEICVTDKAVAQYRLKLRPTGTLLIAMYGSIGKLGLLEAAATTNQAILAINPKPDLVRAEFLFSYLLSQRQALIHSGFGGVQKNLSGAFLKKVRVPVPPLNEQDEVVGTFAALQDMALALDEQRARTRSGPRWFAGISCVGA
jgi:type I restriction enzyme S subunit